MRRTYRRCVACCVPMEECRVLFERAMCSKCALARANVTRFSVPMSIQGEYLRVCGYLSEPVDLDDLDEATGELIALAAHLNLTPAEVTRTLDALMATFGVGKEKKEAT